MHAATPGSAHAEHGRSPVGATTSATPNASETSASSGSTLQSIVIPRGAAPALRLSTSATTPTMRFEFGSFTTQVPVLEAGTTLNCSPGGAFHLTTGTKSGSCTVDSRNGSATCTDGTNSSTAACGGGCGNTSGAGDCTQS